MADVDIDRSCLAPVQEVCRDFAVLEDGALAYCLQEQEIEQHYASNVQKHQLFRRDVRIAKKLQRLEEQAGKRPDPEPQQQQHSQETGSAPDGARRKAEEGRQGKDQAQQEITAKRLQDREEPEKGPRHRQKQRLRSWQGPRGDDTEPLNWAMAELELQGQQQQQQLRRDEALAWKLHAEEQMQLRARKTRQRGDDYRAAQVAQDEEIARYIQDQELTAPWRPPSEDVAAQSFVEAHGSLSEPRQRHGRQKEARQSCAVASPISVQPLESSEAPRGAAAAAAAAIKPQPCRNIAEDLDPTFKAKRMEPPAADGPTCSQAAAPVRPVPVDGFFDYLDEVAESTFVSPTKRQPEKVGRHKSRDRKEGCKQQ
ncbi:coiled-coil domain-containing protein 50-like [Elgaria multicarinata webbii]|uniref:coiled-coil domain-containing protein 50-like n=1 Tax=Elgaria multicarinata webbii TaxID=159646 RepID=UPI002FCD46BA